jgi:light-regulated signal transduction histidine kinase (bacteriophytochrome)
MSPPKKAYSTSSAKSKHSVRVAQTTADAALQAVYENPGDSGDSFDYSKSVSKSTTESVSAGAVTAYLQRMQRGGQTQTFGCMVAVEDTNFRVIAYSENASEFLDLMPQAVPSMGEMDVLGIGTDLRTLFTASSAACLEKAAATQDISLLNPITIHCRRSGKALYAIAHRIDVGIVMDFEAIKMNDVSVSAAGALQSHKLAAKAITRLQALPGGDIGLLCDTVVEEVRELTGYDRVMAYRFHEDEHGEVVAEIRSMDLEPYIGLHYPATDIPQASRFLFMKNRVRVIADCCASPVKVIQDPNIKQPVSLAGSTLRAPHGCHAQYMGNMGSIASLVMAVIINDNEEDSHGAIQRGRKLWGLVVCHHTSPRTVPFPLRSACEFLMQVFGMQLNMEVELAAQLREKHILRTQTLLCDMLLRDAPIGIVSETPNIMDLVKCDGAALYYGKRFWLLGTTPTESQIKDIAEWLLEYHKDSTGLSADSLADANYPGAHLLGDAVCGMAAAKITAKDFLFWFRSHTAKEVKWGGAKHDPGEKDDGRKMHPRTSFKAFLEVVKRRSLPWEDVEMDAIHSLQLILRGSFQDIDDSDTKTMIHARLNDLKLHGMDELSVVANEMVRLIETATAPILAVDSTGMINGWNAKIAQVTGLPVTEAMGRSLVKDLVLDESVVVAERLLYLASQGESLDQNDSLTAFFSCMGYSM